MKKSFKTAKSELESKGFKVVTVEKRSDKTVKRAMSLVNHLKTKK